MIIHHWKSNADGTLSVNTEEKYQYEPVGSISLQYATEIMKYLPFCLQ